MRQIYFLVIIIYVTVQTKTTNLENYALLCHPVADLYSSSHIPKKSCPAVTKGLCARINQALFNELYPIIETKNNATRIAIPWAVYGYDAQGTPQNSYWVANKDILRGSILKNNIYKTIPALHNKQNIVTLKRPFTSPEGITYSIGTQFVSTDTDTLIYYDPKTSSIKEFALPEQAIIRQDTTLTPREKLVHLLTEFVSETSEQPDKNTIAYIWGGSSFTHAYSPEFTQDNNGFHRIPQETGPLSGYDCSNLLLRFAHMAGVPYYFKTTAMLEKHGKKFGKHDHLEAGDLIWMQGHVVIITDIQNMLVTESCGYENFVGKVRTIKLSELLENMHSWKDLLKAYRKKETVTRLDAHGNKYKETPVKIFKLF